MHTQLLPHCNCICQASSMEKKILLMVCFKSCPVSSSFLQESHICLCHIASTTKLHMKTHLRIYTISTELEMSISNHMNTSSCSYWERYPVKRRQWALGLFLHGWLFSLFFLSLWVWGCVVLVGSPYIHNFFFTPSKRSGFLLSRTMKTSLMEACKPSQEKLRNSC